MSDLLNYNDFADDKSIKNGFDELNALLLDTAENLKRFTDSMAKNLNRQKQASNSASDAIDKYIDTLKRLDAATVAGREAIGRTSSALIQVGKKFEESTKRTKDFKGAQEAANESFEKAKKQVDDLKKEYNDLINAQKQGKSSTNEGRKAFDEATDSLEQLNKEYKSNTKRAKEFNDEQEAAADSIDGIKKRINALKKEYNALSQSQDVDKVNEYRNRLALLGAEQKRLQDELKASNKSLGGINEALDFNENSLGGVRKAIKLYKEQLNDATIGSREFERVQARLNAALEKEIEITEKSPSKFAKRIRQAAGESEKVKELSDRLRMLNKQLATAPSDAMFDEIQAQINETKAELDTELTSGGKGQGGAGLFGNLSGIVGKAAPIVAGLTATYAAFEQLLSLEGRFTNLSLEISRAAGISSDAALTLAADVDALSTTFSKDTNELIEAAKNLSKQYGISFDQALKKVESGFLNGADASGDFLDKLKEYPVQFREAGFSADDFIKIATQEVKGGVYDDKLVDSLKELGLSLRELDKAQTDALENAFGKKFADDLARGLKSGRISTKQALSTIRDEFKKTGAGAAEVQKLTSDLFKGAGEDAGGFVEILDQVDKALASNSKELDELGKQQQEQLRIQKELSREQALLAKSFEGLTNSAKNYFTFWKSEGFKVLNKIIELFSTQARVQREASEFAARVIENAGERSVIRIQNSIAALDEVIKTNERLLKKGDGDTEKFQANIDAAIAKRKLEQEQLEQAIFRENKAIQSLEQRYVSFQRTYADLASKTSSITEDKIDELNTYFKRSQGNFDEAGKEALKSLIGQLERGEIRVFEFFDTLRRGSGQKGNKITKEFVDVVSFFLEGLETSAEKTKEVVESVGKTKPVEVGFVAAEDAANLLTEDVFKQIADDIINDEKNRAFLKLKADVEIEELNLAGVDVNNLRRDLDEVTQRELERLDLAKEFQMNAAEFSDNELVKARQLATIERQIAQAKFDALSEEERLSLEGLKLQKKLQESKENELQLQREIIGVTLSGYTDIALDVARNNINEERLGGALALAVVESYLGSIENGASQREAFSAAAKAGSLAVLAKTAQNFKFKDGVIGFKGKGTDTSDDNLVFISNNESVITAKGTRKAPILLDYVNRGLISDADIAGLATSSTAKITAILPSQAQQSAIDYNKLAAAIASAIPKPDIVREAGRVGVQMKQGSKIKEVIISERLKKLK